MVFFINLRNKLKVYLVRQILRLNGLYYDSIISGLFIKICDYIVI